MLPDSGNTSPGEIVMTGVLGLYYGDLVLHGGGKEGAEVTVNRWFKGLYYQEDLGIVAADKRTFSTHIWI